jgi:hypothetical protein
MNHEGHEESFAGSVKHFVLTVWFKFRVPLFSNTGKRQLPLKQPPA